MPRLTQPSASRSLATDQHGASEVLGQVISFGLISVLLVATVLAASQLRIQATERGAEQGAGEVARAVAHATVDLALAVEDGLVEEFSLRIDLPERLAGHAYTVRFEPDSVRVIASGADVTAPLLGISKSPTVSLCTAHVVPGGPTDLRFSTGGPVPAGCALGDLFLEEAS